MRQNILRRIGGSLGHDHIHIHIYVTVHAFLVQLSVKY